MQFHFLLFVFLEFAFHYLFSVGYSEMMRSEQYMFDLYYARSNIT